jgi:adenine-specific DNA-methyltransferase
VIKYLGSKRRLVPLLSAIAQAVHARTAVDLFTGTTRVAQALRSNGTAVTAVDTARYAEVFAQTYVAWDPLPTELQELAATIAELASLPGEPGYVTDVFCSQARYFHPDNGRRIDAIREAIATDHAGTWREPPLLTSLLEAADRVDSTTGVQMAYLKRWAPRALAPLELRVPRPVTGPAGRAVRAEAGEVAATLGAFDLAYLDPPYNQHRYFTNYHVWETLVAWDRPPHYGVACKRLDARDPATASDFNRRRHMPAALRSCIDAVDARVVVVSYNDEAWLTLDELRDMLGSKGVPIVLAVDSKRYVGAQIGVHDPAGRRVGTVSHLRNTEYVIVAGDLSPPERRAVEQAGRHHGAVVIGEGAAMTRTVGP